MARVNKTAVALDHRMSCPLIQRDPGVAKLLAGHPKIATATRHLQQCSECALFFYRELLAHIKDLAFPRNPEGILPWGLVTLGYNYDEIEVILGEQLFPLAAQLRHDLETMQPSSNLFDEFARRENPLSPQAKIERHPQGWNIIDQRDKNNRQRYLVKSADLTVHRCMPRGTIRSQVSRARKWLLEVSTVFQLEFE